MLPPVVGQSNVNLAIVSQSRLSTIILECLLAFMTICALTAFVSMRVHDLVQDNPCSIATQMSMFQGSEELVELVRNDLKGLDQESIEQDFEPGTFHSLGWWPTEVGDRYRIGIGKAPA